MKARFYFIQKLSLLLLLLPLTLFNWGCDKRSCKDVVCGYRQTCVNGQCLCPNGYEGDNCDIRSRDKMLGYYNVSVSCNPPGGNCGSLFGGYSVQVQEGGRIEEIRFNNIVNNGLSAIGVIRENYIQIPDQNMGASTITGEGNFLPGSNRIEMRVQYIVSGSQCVCDLTFF